MASHNAIRKNRYNRLLAKFRSETDSIPPSWLHEVDPCQVFLLLERLSPLKHHAIDLAQLYRSCELPNKMFVGSELDKAVSRRYNLNIQARTVQPERCQDVRIIIQLHDHCPYSDWTRIEQGRGGSLLTPKPD